MHAKLFILLCVIGGCLGVNAAELTSKNNFKLKAVYDAVPRTDENGDGTLTLLELRSYVETKFRDWATSRNSLYLSRFYKAEPISDINRDGVLTKSELLDHLKYQGEHYASLN